MRVWEVRDKTVPMFQFKTDFTDINRPLNLAVKPHLLYTLLVAVYFFTFILKIFVILLGYTKISCIFVKEITTKKNQNEPNSKTRVSKIHKSN